MPMNESEAREQRRRRREFIRVHHPDRGGDADLFVEGLQALGEPPGPGPLPPVILVRRRRWLTRLGLAAARRLHRGSRPPRVR